jgi:hypothetical protein
VRKVYGPAASCDVYVTIWRRLWVFGEDAALEQDAAASTDHCRISGAGSSFSSETRPPDEFRAPVLELGNMI